MQRYADRVGIGQPYDTYRRYRSLCNEPVMRLSVLCPRCDVYSLKVAVRVRPFNQRYHTSLSLLGIYMRGFPEGISEHHQ